MADMPDTNDIDATMRAHRTADLTDHLIAIRRVIGEAVADVHDGRSGDLLNNLYTANWLLQEMINLLESSKDASKH
jgi:hypothetical protein